MKETKLAICEVCGTETECRLIKSDESEFYMCHECIVHQVKDVACSPTIKEYRCIKDLQVEICDGDGFSTGKENTIKAGSTWIDDGEPVCSCGDVHLENLEGAYGWLEIPTEDLEEHFELIK